MRMTYLLKFRYDDRDFLELWLPEFDSATEYEFEDGLYDYASAAKHKGSNRAFDSIMVDAFSNAYSDVIDEVRRKEREAHVVASAVDDDVDPLTAAIEKLDLGSTEPCDVGLGQHIPAAQTQKDVRRDRRVRLQRLMLGPR